MRGLFYLIAPKLAYEGGLSFGFYGEIAKEDIGLLRSLEAFYLTPMRYRPARYRHGYHHTSTRRQRRNR